MFIVILFALLHLSVCQKYYANSHALLFDPDSLTVAVGKNVSTTIQLVSEHDDAIDVSFVYGEERSLTTDYIQPLEPAHFPRHPSHMQIVLTIKGLRPGHLIVGCNVTSDLQMNLTERDFLRINIARSIKLDRVISTIGWLYFVAWSCSFYPQMLLNFRRQSVVGLHFDFLALNLVGFLCYSIYNIGLYSWRDVQNGYMKLHPHGVIPVLINDVVFSIHGFIASLVTIFQCLFFQRSKQRVSHTTTILLVLFVLFLTITTIITAFRKIDLLLLIYFYSYVKIIISCIKYIPQIVLNYRRKSTEGWSIGYVLFDFIGGIVSLIQMFLLAINYNDWSSFLGSITKVVIGIGTIGFDLVFMIQHYILYRKASKEQADEYQILDDTAPEQASITAESVNA